MAIIYLLFASHIPGLFSDPFYTLCTQSNLNQSQSNRGTVKNTGILSKVRNDDWIFEALASRSHLNVLLNTFPENSCRALTVDLDHPRVRTRVELQHTTSQLSSIDVSEDKAAITPVSVPRATDLREQVNEPFSCGSGALCGRAGERGTCCSSPSTVSLRRAWKDPSPVSDGLREASSCAPAAVSSWPTKLTKRSQ